MRYTSVTALLLLLLFGQHIDAQELIFKSFNHLEDNTTARINRRRDVNGQGCAIIIIKHNFKDFKVETGKEYEALEEKVGETWVWVSPDEYRIVLRKEGYLPFPFDLKGKLQQLETYELIITDEFGDIKINAPKAEIWLDNKLAGRDSIILTLKEGRYVLRATREKYYEEEKFAVLNAGDNLEFNFDLKPKTGSLVLSSIPQETKGADIYIDNEILKQKTPSILPLIIGDYSLRVVKQGFLPFIQQINIVENESIEITAKMEVDPTILFMKNKRQKHLWIASTLVSGTIGGFSLYRADKLSDDYKSAEEEAGDLHTQIATYDLITPIAFGLAGLSLVKYIYHTASQSKAKRKLNLYGINSSNEISLGFVYLF